MNMKLFNEVDILNFWYAGKTLQEIANEYDVTRQAVKYHLNKRGISTGKRSKKIDLVCVKCGKVFKRLKSYSMRSNRIYCSHECYFASLHNPGYNQNRQGQRIARRVVSEIFDFESGHVVHHEDGDCMNNELSNLIVFRNQSDHLKWHRGVDGVTPLWRIVK